MHNAVRTLFFGTAAIACPTLQALLDCPRLQVLAAVTQPDRPKGRALQPAPSPVKSLAQAAGIPVLQPALAKDPAFIAAARELAPAMAVVMAYGQILPQPLLDVPVHGCLNIHTSLLPRHRGAAPIQWALLSGDTETGVTIIKMDAGLDTGDILSAQTVPIAPSDTAVDLHDRLGKLGAELLLRTIDGFLSGKIIPQRQPITGITYARKITRQDGAVQWSDSAQSLHRRLRALLPWPGLYTGLLVGGQAKLLKILAASAESTAAAAPPPGTVISAGADAIVVACGSGALRITRLQLEGGRPLQAAEFIAGHSLLPGSILGAAPL